MAGTSQLSRRAFARMLGLGAGAAVAAPMMARGFEEHLAVAAGAVLPQPPPMKRLPKDPENLILLNSNENPYGPSEAAREAMVEAHEVAGRYPDFYIDKLQEKIAGMHRVEPGNIAVTCGSTEFLKMCAWAFLGPGKQIVQATPTFEALAYYAQGTGAEVVKVPMDEYYKHDLEPMAEAARRKPSLVYICNPNNPTGTVVSRAAINGLLRRVPEETIVLVDEAYHHYVDDASYGSLDRFVADSKNIVVARTFSKIYGMAGMRIGYGIAPEFLMSRLWPHGVFSSANVMGSVAAYATIEDRRAHRRFLFQSVRKNQETREFLKQAMRERGHQTIPSNTNFVCVDVQRPVLPVIQAFREKGIRVGRPFEGLPHHLRVSLGLPEEMEKYVAAFDAVMAAGPKN